MSHLSAETALETIKELRDRERELRAARKKIETTLYCFGKETR